MKPTHSLRQLIANNQLEEAILQLRTLLENSPQLNEAILQSGRLQDISKQIRLGTISHIDATLTKNQIRAGLLDFIYEIEAMIDAPEAAALRGETEQGMNVVNSKNIAVNTKISSGGHTLIGDNNTINQFVQQTNKKIPRYLSTTLPLIPEVFIGRDEAIIEVHEKLFSGDTLLVLVNGEGGIGKTSFAAKYWQRYEAKYNHLAWVFVGSSLPDALLSMAPALSLDLTSVPTADERLERLLLALASLDKPSLLVLDNANSSAELQRYYPALRRCPNFHLLLTSRVTTLAQAEIYPIPPLCEDDALLAFKKHYPAHRADDDDIFRATYRAVGGNTLVLELMAKNLAVINADEAIYPLSRLLDDLRQHGLFGIRQQTISVVPKQGLTFIETQPAAVLAALYDEVEMVKPLNETEQALMSNFAVLPAERIAYTTLRELLRPDDIDVFSRILTDLARRGWLEKNAHPEGGTQYKISPVVQEITRYKNRKSLRFHINTLLHILLEISNYDNIPLNNYHESTHCAKYVESLLEVLNDPDFNMSVLCYNIGYYYLQVGDLGKALSIYGKQQTMIKALFNADQNNLDFKNSLAINLRNHGETYTLLGDLNNALTCFNEYHKLESELCNLYPDNTSYKNELAISYEKLGSTYMVLKNIEDALTCFNKYHKLESELCNLYPDSTSYKNELAISFEKLGSVYLELHNIDKALFFFKKYNYIETKLCKDVPNNLGFLNNLAISCEKLGETHTLLGNLDEAVKFYKKYNKLEIELNVEYPKNVEFKNRLATSYLLLGKFWNKKNDAIIAKQNLQKAYELFGVLMQDFPDRPSFQENYKRVKDLLAIKDTDLLPIKKM